MGIIDVTIGGDGRQDNNDDSEASKKRFIGVRFQCAGDMYMRFYKNAQGSAYVGRCPKCMKDIKVGIAAHGTSARFFTYDCGRT